MSMTQTISGPNTPDGTHCVRCGNPLPPQATFCGTCGERVAIPDTTNRSLDTNDLTSRYRFTTLVQRHPYIQLFLANDLQRQRPVAIRDIDISSLGREARKQAANALRQEYDLLRREHIPGVMPVVDMHIQRDHLYVVASWLVANDIPTAPETRLYTLQDLFQSGIGLPDETVALAWGYRLARAIHLLHMQHITLGNLDAKTIAVSDISYVGQPALIVSWLPMLLRDLLSYSVDTNAHHFSAPEVLLNHIEPRSDIYSLGALLYLLLTGKAPDEATLRMQRPMRTPRELNTRISADISDLVMHALAIESTERFRSAGIMAQALLQAYCNLTGADPQLLGAGSTNLNEELPIDNSDEVTISIVPLRSRLVDLYLTSMRAATQEDQQQQVRVRDAVAMPPVGNDTPRPIIVEADEPSPSTDLAAELLLSQAYSLTGTDIALPHSDADEDQQEMDVHVASSPLQRMKTQLSGLLPILTHPRGVHASPETKRKARQEQSFLKRLQHFILGEQQHTTAAAALIETPMRVQPNQGYVIRMHITGRDTPKPLAGASKGESLAGLSAFTKGSVVHIEVRSALYQNYAYIVQRADVALPGNGYSAEVSIPMQPLANSASGRRERLHIFFTDDLRRPLYEKPFVVEVFVSPLVQNGREGYNVLTIPL